MAIVYLSFSSSSSGAVARSLPPSTSTTTTTLPKASLAPPISNSAAPREREQEQELQRPPPSLKRRQRWQWSKGDGPGEYGGPPLDFRVRRMWGGAEVVPDPITTTHDYIWNKEWRSFLPSEEPSPPSPSSEKPAEVGFLSLKRSIALDRIEVDLTKELAQPEKSVLALQVEAVREGLPTDEAIREDKPRWRMAPTRREQKQWARARKPGGMAMLVSEGGEVQDVTDSRVDATLQDYNRIKSDMQLLTAIFGGVGSAVAYVSYSAEVAFSYGVGLLGALAYVRMLGNSVDSLGQSDSKSAIRGALGQPRLLVPVVLVMFFNRWNGVIAPEYSLLHLQLIPILVGFFTYKAATVVEVFRDALQGAFNLNPAGKAPRIMYPDIRFVQKLSYFFSSC